MLVGQQLHEVLEGGGVHVGVHRQVEAQAVCVPVLVVASGANRDMVEVVWPTVAKCGQLWPPV